MKAAIKALEGRLEGIQQEIADYDNSTAELRKRIDGYKVRLIELYRDRDEVASAIFKLKSAT